MRVKKLMKEEADVKAVAGDASYAAARATVSFPQLWPRAVAEAYSCSLMPKSLPTPNALRGVEHNRLFAECGGEHSARM